MIKRFLPSNNNALHNIVNFNQYQVFDKKVSPKSLFNKYPEVQR